jgi:hypothetical protein
MANDERGTMKGKDSCDSVEGGYTIFLDGAKISSFMESGDFSSARELDHFSDIGSRIEKKISEGEGHALLALSVTAKRVSRDFTALEIAHVLAKHGKRVLIVDCDFLQPGLSGIVENIDEQGFLDLLLYGSSLKSVVRSTGIDGVSYTGAGSFPVSKTIPFAQKEFMRVKQFLGKQCDVVIYSSTLYTEDGGVNPLCSLVDGIILTCPIEEMDEGQLQKHLADLGSDVPPVDLVCYCGKGEEAAAAAAAPGAEVEKREPEISLPEEAKPDIEPPREEPLIEKMEEIGASERGGRSGVNIPRIATIAFGIIIIIFIGWWILTERSIRDKESSSQMTELVQKQLDAREAVDRSATGPAATDSLAEEEETPGEVGAGGQAQAESIEDGKDVIEQQAEGRREAAAPPPESKPVVSGDRYGIHVHSFRTVEKASTGARDLEKRGYEVEVIESVVKGRTIFRVYVVGFENRDEAISASVELRALYGYAQVKKLNSQ